MGIKEGTCWDEHWVLYVSDESLDSPPKAKTKLYVNQVENKKKKKERNRILIIENKVMVTRGEMGGLGQIGDGG